VQLGEGADVVRTWCGCSTVAEQVFCAFPRAGWSSQRAPGVRSRCALLLCYSFRTLRPPRSQLIAKMVDPGRARRIPGPTRIPPRHCPQGADRSKQGIWMASEFAAHRSRDGYAHTSSLPSSARQANGERRTAAYQQTHPPIALQSQIEAPLRGARLIWPCLARGLLAPREMQQRLPSARVADRNVTDRRPVATPVRPRSWVAWSTAFSRQPRHLWLFSRRCCFRSPRPTWPQGTSPGSDLTS